MSKPFNLDSDKLGIVTDWLTVMGGAEEVTRTLHQSLPNAPILTAQYNPANFKWLADADVRGSWLSKMPLSKTKHYLYSPILADVYRHIDVREFDFVLAFSHTFAHNVRPREDAVMFAYYCTVARSLWVPEIDGRAGSGWLREQIVRRLKRLDLEAAKRPTYVTAISRTGADRVEKFYKRPVDAVIYPAVAVENWMKTPRVSTREGFTMWSRLIPYKRFDLAIEAAKLGGFKLNIVGAGPDEARLKEIAAGASNVVFHGRLADEPLSQLLSESQGVLFPAYEDFGIVPIEAMAAGLPVVVFKEGGAAETITQEFGEQIATQTPQELADAVARLQSREFDAEKLRERAFVFRYDRFHEELMTHLNLAAERGVKRNFLP
ncbi:MAG TPA: glycosyltransferase [Fimbriimonas sp.]|nr:glycosyltransferase [Fimbriimonas sp.]